MLGQTPSIVTKHIFGIKSDVQGTIYHVDESKIIYVAGHNIVIYHTDTDDKIMQFFPGLDNSRGITCIALSPLRRHLAVAERADPAIVVVYDTHTQRKKKMMETPDCQSSEYVSMAFAPGQENKYLITMGGAPDWTLVYWQWERPRVLSYIRVSTANPVYQISFNQQDHNYGIIATGDDVFSWFKMIDNNLRAQTTEIHNSDSQLSKNYLCHCWLKDGRLAVGTDNAEILILDSNCEYLGYIDIGIPDFQVTCIINFESGFLAGGSNTQVLTFVYEGDERQLAYTQQSRTIIAQAGSTAKIQGMSLSFQTEDKLIMALTNSQLFSIDFNSDNVQGEPLAQHFHTGEITGLDACIRKPLVVTCGLDKTIRIWNYQERELEICSSFNEEPYSVAFHPSGFHIVAGFADKLRMMNVTHNAIKSYKDISIRSCREVRFSYGGHLFAAASGSMIKVFNFYTAEGPPNFEFKSHSARVTSIAWREDDTGFVSAGADSSVFEWPLYPDNTNTIHKQSYQVKGCQYTSVLVAPDAGAGDERTIYAAGNDRFLKEIIDSQSERKFDTGSIINQIVLSHSGRLLFAGVGEQDLPGPVRCYKFSPFTGDYSEFQAHSGSIERMRVSHDDCYLFSAGKDGCLIVWEVKDKDIRALRREKEALGLAFAEELMITRAEIEELNQQIENWASSNRDLENNYKQSFENAIQEKQDTIDKLKEQIDNEQQQEKNRYDSLADSKKEMDTQYEERIRTLKEQFENEKQEIEAEHQHKFMVEVGRYQELSRDKEAEATAAKNKIEEFKIEHSRQLEIQQNEFEVEISEQKAEVEKLKSETEEQVRRFEMIEKQLVEENQTEIEEVKNQNNLELRDIKAKSLKDKGKTSLAKRKSTMLSAEMDKLRDELNTKEEQHRNWAELLNQQAEKLKRMRNQITEKDNLIGEKEKKIYDLKQKNQNLEKFKFVLDYKIRESKRLIGPMEEQIAKMKKQTSKMDTQLKKLSGVNESLGGFVEELRQKLKGMKQDISNQRDKIRSSENKIKQIKNGIYDCVQFIQDIRQLKASILKLFNDFVKTEGRTQEPETEKEFARQCQYLEGSIQKLREKLKAVSGIHTEKIYKVMQENMELIKEIHDLRRERKELQPYKRQYELLVQKQRPKNNPRLEEYNRQIERNKEELKELRKRINEYDYSERDEIPQLDPESYIDHFPQGEEVSQ